LNENVQKCAYLTHATHGTLQGFSWFAAALSSYEVNLEKMEGIMMSVAQHLENRLPALFQIPQDSLILN
jgi:hypothetical protein